MEFTIGIVDLSVLVLYLCGAVGLGLWLGRAKQDLAGYLLAGRNLPWWAILGSIVATETSTVTFLSIPGLAFNPQGGNLEFLQIAVGYIIGRSLIVVWLLPLYFRGQLLTAYDVLEKRFGGRVKQFASVVFLITRNLGDGLRLFLTAIVLERMLHIPLPWCIFAVGLATIAYTYYGGMRSVVWNDCIQFVVYMAGGLLAALILLEKIPGGWEGFWEFGRDHQKFQWLRWRTDPGQPFWTGLTFWSGLIGGMFLTLGTHGADQMIVQRYLCARSRAHASWALFLSGFVVFVQFALFLLIGVGLAAFYHHFPPSKAFARNDEVFAAFILDQMPRNVGVVGLLLAAVFAAAMSTLSSSLNSSAASLVNDLYPAQRIKASSPEQRIRSARRWTIVFGQVQILIGIGAMAVSESVVNSALAIAGFSAGVLLGVFALGTFTRHVDHFSALVGMVCGVTALTVVKFAVPMIIAIGEMFRLPQGRMALIEFAAPLIFPPIHWTWFAFIGAVVTFVCGWFVSWVRPTSPNL